MIQLQRYHPIFTEHYRWEFLSNLSGQQIQKFLQVDIATSAHFANQAMQQIMANQGITWGITFKQQDELLGIISLNDLTKTPKLKIQFKNTVPLEILKRLSYFIKEQLQLTEFNIDPDSSDRQIIYKFLN